MADASTKPDRTGALKHLWLSPWTAWVGVRYLKSKKNSKFLSFITLLSVLGVGLGVTSMIVVLSVMDGFEAELKKRLMASDLHVLITPTSSVLGYDSGFVPQDALEKTALPQIIQSDPHVLTFWPILSTEAILKSGRKVTGVVLKGITPERLERLKRQVVESATSSSVEIPGVYVGQELAYEMSLISGDLITLISPTETEGPMDTVPRLKRFRIEGVYHSGLPDQELHTVYSSDASVRSFLRRANVISQWEVTTKNFDYAGDLADRMKKQASGFKIQDWSELNSHLFASLKLERVAMFVILAFIVVVASFNIVTTLTLMVLEKKREISILKAMGARHGQVAAIFLAEGILIGVIGIGGGLILGFVICVILKRYEFIALPDVYYDRTLPVTFEPSYYLLVAGVATVIVLAACLYPSKRAAALNPLEGIRFG